METKLEPSPDCLGIKVGRHGRAKPKVGLGGTTPLTLYVTYCNKRHRLRRRNGPLLLQVINVRVVDNDLPSARNKC